MTREEEGESKRETKRRERMLSSVVPPACLNDTIDLLRTQLLY